MKGRRHPLDAASASVKRWWMVCPSCGNPPRILVNVVTGAALERSAVAAMKGIKDPADVLLPSDTWLCGCGLLYLTGDQGWEWRSEDLEGNTVLFRVLEGRVYAYTVRGRTAEGLPIRKGPHRPTNARLALLVEEELNRILLGKVLES